MFFHSLKPKVRDRLRSWVWLCFKWAIENRSIHNVWFRFKFYWGDLKTWLAIFWMKVCLTSWCCYGTWSDFGNCWNAWWFCAMCKFFFYFDTWNFNGIYTLLWTATKWLWCGNLLVNGNFCAGCASSMWFI